MKALLLAAVKGLLALLLTVAMTSLFRPAIAQELKWLAACDGAPFGIRIEQVSDLIGRSFGMDKPRGALVAGLDKDTASCAGIEVGDLILKFNGREINQYEELVNIVAASEVGKQLPVVTLREGTEKTKVVKLALPPSSLRTPGCAEFIPFTSWMPPGAIERVFGKRFGDMRLNEFDQATAALTYCESAVRGSPNRQLRFIPFSIVRDSLAQEKNGLLARQVRERGRDELELRKRLEAERKATEVRIRTEQAEATRRVEAERKAALAIAKAEECRQQCPRKLTSMLDLGTDDAGINRFRELGSEYQQMINDTPIDVKGELVAKLDAFDNAYTKYKVPMGKAEQELIEKRLAAEEQLRQQILGEKKNKEQREQLGLFYLNYMQLQFCAQRFPNFLEAMETARDVAKNKESGFSTRQIEEIWNATGRGFAKIEPLLRTTSNLFVECSGASNTLTGIIISGQGQPSQSKAPRKDF